MVSEVSVHSGLPPNLWASGQAECHRRKVRQNKAVQFIATRKGKGRGGDREGRGGREEE